MTLLACSALLLGATIPSAVPWETGRPVVLGINYSALTPERSQAFGATRLQVSIGGASFVAGWGVSTAGIQPLRDLGLDVYAYMSPSCLYGDAVFEQVPQARSWLAVKRSGEPYVRDYRGAKRYSCCLNNESWRAKQRESLLELIQAGCGGVFWDDAFPVNCYCATCEAAFRQFLRKLREKPANPPPMDTPMLDYRDVHSRLELRWVQFQQATVVDFIEDMTRAGRRARRDFVTSMNTSQPGVTQCLDLSARTADLFLYEEGPHTMAPGRCNALRNLIAFARGSRKPPSMLLGRDDWGYTGATPLELQTSIAEAQATGSVLVLHLGHAGKDDEWFRVTPDTVPAVQRYEDFIFAHEDLMAGWSPGARVCFYYSPESARWRREHYSDMQVAFDRLQFAGWPLAVVSGEESLDRLKDFDVAVLVSCDVLTNPQVSALRDFTRRGGKLVVLGSLGGTDPLGQPLPDYALADVTGLRKGAGADQALADWGCYSADMPDAAALRRALDEVLGQRGVRLEAPPEAKVLCTAWRKGSRLAVHLVNYAHDPGTFSPLPARGCRLWIPGRVREMTLLSPDHEPQTLEAHVAGDRSYVRLPDLGVWEIVVATEALTGG